MRNKKYLIMLPLCFLLLFNGKKYDKAVIDRLQIPIKICLEGQDCGNAASASQSLASIPVVAEKVELSEGSEHIIRMLNTGDEGQMIFEPSVIKVSKGDTIHFKATDMSHNSASVEGGGIKFTGSSPSIEFCTIANNASNVCAGGIVAVYDQVYIRNSIVYGNGAGSLCTIQGGSFYVSNSNIEGGYDGEENINADPLFCDADGDDFTLAQNSSSLNASEDNNNIGAEGVGCGAAYVNNALSFDGSSYIDLLNTENIEPESISVSAWIKLFTINNEVQIVSKYDGTLGKAWNLCIQES